MINWLKKYKKSIHPSKKWWSLRRKNKNHPTYSIVADFCFSIEGKKSRSKYEKKCFSKRPIPFEGTAEYTHKVHSNPEQYLEHIEDGKFMVTNDNKFCYVCNKRLTNNKCDAEQLPLFSRNRIQQVVGNVTLMPEFD